ncbi:ferredoxin [Streptomonospora nanhaiensis]|nr:ferredoxin [Streptomonospora nanhaiensis]MBV2366018.1 ferredoxin [Streptomonospora nanhaiensis]MBX9391221.1 ferredoxin [Streptomonospora nanhaiensis]
MRPRIDRDRCVGAGMCVLRAPDTFDQDPDDGRVVLLDPAPPPHRHASVREAAQTCPSGAVALG